MKFEISINERTVFSTEYKERLPSFKELEAIYSAGYKFQLNGKRISLNDMKEYILKAQHKNN